MDEDKIKDKTSWALVYSNIYIVYKKDSSRTIKFHVDRGKELNKKPEGILVTWEATGKWSTRRRPLWPSLNG